MKKQGVFLRADASEPSEATIDIVGVIGWEVAFQELRAIFAGLSPDVRRVVFEIYSPGGNVWDGNGIVQAIGELGKKVETEARVQVAASMATLIAVACQKRTIARNGRWLIHNAWTSTQGDAEEHEKAAKQLRDCEQEAAKFYAERTGKTPEEMLDLMAEERWIMPEEAKALGFVHEISDPFDTEAVAAVRKEIEAAGKWPMGLADIPEEKPQQEGGNDGNATCDGTEAHEAVEPVEPVVATVSAKTYEDGVADGRDEMARFHEARVKELDAERQSDKVKLQQAEAEARKQQSEKDKAVAALSKEIDVLKQRSVAAMAEADAIINKLRAEKQDIAARLARFLGGSLAFSPDYQTWEEALAANKGDYSKTRQQYPALYAQYMADKRQKDK